MVGWKLKPGQRVMFADKLPDTANLAVGALVFGQFLGTEFSTRVAAFGLGVWGVLIAWAAVLAAKDER